MSIITRIIDHTLPKQKQLDGATHNQGWRFTRETKNVSVQMSVCQAGTLLDGPTLQ